MTERKESGIPACAGMTGKAGMTGTAGQRSAGSERIIPNTNRRLQVSRTRRKLFGKARQEAFLEHLAATCNVTASAAAADICVGSVYRERMRNPEFRAAWGQALEQGYARLEAALLARAAAGGRYARGQRRQDRERGGPFDRLRTGFRLGQGDGPAPPAPARNGGRAPARRACHPAGGDRGSAGAGDQEAQGDRLSGGGGRGPSTVLCTVQ